MRCRQVLYIKTDRAKYTGLRSLVWLASEPASSPFECAPAHPATDTSSAHARRLGHRAQPVRQVVDGAQQGAVLGGARRRGRATSSRAGGPLCRRKCSVQTGSRARPDPARVRASLLESFRGKREAEEARRFASERPWAELSATSSPPSDLSLDRPACSCTEYHLSNLETPPSLARLRASPAAVASRQLVSATRPRPRALMAKGARHDLKGKGKARERTYGKARDRTRGDKPRVRPSPPPPLPALISPALTPSTPTARSSSRTQSSRRGSYRASSRRRGSTRPTSSAVRPSLSRSRHDAPERGS